MRRSTFLAGVAVALCAAACNALDFADFDSLPELGRDLNANWNGKVTITRFHSNPVTNGVKRCWIEFHCGSFQGVLPDATNITVMGCETVQAVFRGTFKEWRRMDDDLKARYRKIRMVSPWSPQKADVLKLREVPFDGVCVWCEELPPHKHAVYSATFDMRQSLDDYGGFNNGYHFYVDAGYLVDGE